MVADIVDKGIEKPKQVVATGNGSTIGASSNPVRTAHEATIHLPLNRHELFTLRNSWGPARKLIRSLRNYPEGLGYDQIRNLYLHRHFAARDGITVASKLGFVVRAERKGYQLTEQGLDLAKLELDEEVTADEGRHVRDALDRQPLFLKLWRELLARFEGEFETADITRYYGQKGGYNANTSQVYARSLLNILGIAGLVRKGSKVGRFTLDRGWALSSIDMTSPGRALNLPTKVLTPDSAVYSTQSNGIYSIEPPASLPVDSELVVSFTSRRKRPSGFSVAELNRICARLLWFERDPERFNSEAEGNKVISLIDSLPDTGHSAWEQHALQLVKDLARSGIRTKNRKEIGMVIEFFNAVAEYEEEGGPPRRIRQAAPIVAGPPARSTESAEEGATTQGSRSFPTPTEVSKFIEERVKAGRTVCTRDLQSHFYGTTFSPGASAEAHLRNKRLVDYAHNARRMVARRLKGKFERAGRASPTDTIWRFVYRSGSGGSS